MNFFEAMADNRAAMEAVTVPQMRALLPVLKEAQREATNALARFLRESDGAATYTIQQHRALLVQLHNCIWYMANKVGPAAEADILHETSYAQTVAIERLKLMMTVGEQQFIGAVTPIRLDIAAVMARSERMVISRFPTSAKRYARDIGADLRNRLMLGVVRGETIDQLTTRLLGSAKLRRRFEQMGPMHEAEGVAGQVFNSYRSRAERLVRTEINNAYNYTQVRGIAKANREDPGWCKRWDAANDFRTCPYCRELDGDVVDVDEDFKGGVDHPPLHPNDRCSVTPWRREWPKNFAP